MDCTDCNGTGLTPGQAAYEATELCPTCEGSGFIGKRPKPGKVVEDSKTVEPIDPELLKKPKKSTKPKRATKKSSAKKGKK